MNFQLIPAIDLRHGQVVRLYQGDYGRQTDYDIEPLALAHNYAASGVEWLHVVDLDGARKGHPLNMATLKSLTSAGLKVQAGGGVRSEKDITRLFEAGVTRVVIGSMAVREPDTVRDWLQRYGAERLTIALDTRWHDGAWRLPTGGWITDAAATLDKLAPYYAQAGARHLLCTDIHCDGALTGPNLDLYSQLRRMVPSLALQASGGIRDVHDIQTLRDAGMAGAVLGRALLEGHFTLAEATLAC
ncbi:MAG: 1-(5-phosphoribosyl)-5-[(5-phosphoribosylamino)methylideneamino]imidazole-4-carboxamide isomerase [Xanthomonadales bacterium]|nr:1-(5-phosphoribosyl)-5-[(5-phosphoribosylamino)methylideneamino]imidazole-4-carboxamide isomerase [Xanthomonadales bacterium]